MAAGIRPLGALSLVCEGDTNGGMLYCRNFHCRPTQASYWAELTEQLAGEAATVGD